MKTAISAPPAAAHAPAQSWAPPQADHRPATVAQRQALSTIDSSPRQVAQRQALATNAGSPHQADQRQPAGMGSEPVAQLAKKKTKSTKKKNAKKQTENGVKKKKHNAKKIKTASVAPTGHMAQSEESDEEMPESFAPALASPAVAGSGADDEEMTQEADQSASPEAMVLHLPPTPGLVGPGLTPALVPGQQPTAATVAKLPGKVGGLDYSDIDDDEEDGEEAQAHHLSRVTDKPLDELRRQMYEDPSSESEADATYLPNRRRKAAMLTGIAAASVNLTPEQREQRAAIQQARKAAFTQRHDMRHKYAAPEQAQFMQVGEQLKAQSLYHNDYLRRATRGAVSEDQAQQGGSKAYGQRQGVIRDKLLKVLQQDHEKMDWKREDFADDETWDILQYLLRNKMSGASAKDKKTTPLSEAVKAGVDTSEAEKLNSATEFHHVAFKESMGGQFAHLALNPANLVAVHGRRSEKETPDGEFGMHQFLHDITGYDASDEFEERAGLAKAKGGKKAGGVFSDIDTEALYYTMKPLATKRASKTLTHKPKPEPPAKK